MRSPIPWPQILLLLWVCSMASACEGPAPGPAAGVELPPGVLTSPQAIARGRGLFERHCAVCHGDGRGNGPRASRLASRPADLTGALWQRGLTPGDVHRVIRDGVPGTDMPSFTGLDEDDRLALTAFVLSLDGSPGRADAGAATTPRVSGDRP